MVESVSERLAPVTGTLELFSPRTELQRLPRLISNPLATASHQEEALLIKRWALNGPGQGGHRWKGLFFTHL